MKKNVFGRKLQRDTNERNALFKGLISSLVLHERLETTEAKAKSIKSEIDKLVTRAKKGGNASIKIISSSINPIAVDKFINDVAPRFANRNGGYTRIIKTGNRLGDQAPMVIIEWVEKAKQIVEVVKVKETKKLVVKTKVTKKPVKKLAKTKKVAKKTK